MKYQTILSPVLLISTLAHARFLKFPAAAVAASTAIISCVTDSDYGSVVCSSAVSLNVPESTGVQPTTIEPKTTQPPSLSGAKNSTRTFSHSSGSFCATKTVTITVARGQNGTHSTFTSGGRHNGTSTSRHHRSSSAFTSGGTQTSETSTLTLHSSSSSFPAFTTITDVPLIPPGGFGETGQLSSTPFPSPISGSPLATKAASASSLTILTIGGYD